jgi:hypothetical protein
MDTAKKSALALLLAAAASPAFSADMAVKARVAPVPYVQYNPILDANNQIILQAVGTYLDYAEYDDGRAGAGVILPPGTFVDSEKGWSPGIGIKASVMRDWFLGNDYLSVEASYSKGRTDYMQGPALGVVYQTHDAEFTDFAFRWGKGFAVSPNVMITPFVEYGYHQWVRSVNAGETYEHQYAGGGVLLQYAATQALVLGASGFVGSTIDPNISIAANPGANLAVDNLGLGTSLIWRVGGSFDYALTRAWHVSGSVDYTDFRYGASTTVPALGPGYEPMSKSFVTTAKLGIGYSWGAPGPVVAKY